MMSIYKQPVIFIGVIMAGLLSATAQPDSSFHIYLLFGQSNMAGGCNHATVAPESIDRQPEDCQVTQRVRVLAWGDCNNTSSPCPDLELNRTHDQWYDAFPPYHKCTEGIGPADYFGKTLLDSISEEITIGFIPSALSGQRIEIFEKGSTDSVDSHTRPQRGSGELAIDAYGWMVERCQIAQQTGVIKGILFHQGESNNGDAAWVGHVKGIFDNLKQDLNLDDDIPIVVGELLQDEGACCTAHNPLVNQLAEEYPTGLASSEGLEMRPGDQWNAHFSCAGTRELGRRFAHEFLKMADNDYIPRKYPVAVRHPNNRAAAVHSWNDGVRVFTINGKYFGEVERLRLPEAAGNLKPGSGYVIVDESGESKLVLNPEK